jgi:hypothetical protein
MNNLLIVQIRWWNGPVAVAVHIKSKQEIDNFLEFIPKLLATQSTQIHIAECHDMFIVTDAIDS